MTHSSFDFVKASKTLSVLRQQAPYFEALSFYPLLMFLKSELNPRALVTSQFHSSRLGFLPFKLAGACSLLTGCTLVVMWSALLRAHCKRLRNVNKDDLHHNMHTRPVICPSLLYIFPGNQSMILVDHNPDFEYLLKWSYINYSNMHIYVYPLSIMV